MDISKLPALNAALNSASAVFLVLGYVFIRQRALTGHVMSMLAAFGTSILFLVSYLYYHAHHGSTPYLKTGVIRWVYFSILISHTILAVVNLPLSLTTIILGLRGKFGKHVRIARITFPIWLYVSGTGVVIYWMLYHG